MEILNLLPNFDKLSNSGWIICFANVFYQVASELEWHCILTNATPAPFTVAKSPSQEQREKMFLRLMLQFSSHLAQRKTSSLPCPQWSHTCHCRRGPVAIGTQCCQNTLITNQHNEMEEKLSGNHKNSYIITSHLQLAGQHSPLSSQFHTRFHILGVQSIFDMQYVTVVQCTFFWD